MRLIILLFTVVVGILASTSVVTGNCGNIPFSVSGSGITAVIDNMDRAHHCETDVQGPNDVPGQKDLNMYCANIGPNSSQLFYWSWDDINWSGGNTGDACILLDSNNNGLADLALCVSVGGNGVFQSKHFYKCTGDSSTDRCFGSEEITPPSSGFLSNCCIKSNSPVDPFYVQNSKKKTGDHYPDDTLARCQVFLSDFQKANLNFIDVCSYPSEQPNSDPSDCVLTKFCVDKQGNPDDSLCPPRNTNGCWSGFCDATLGVCRSVPNTAGTVCEKSGSESYCDGKDVCDSAGICVSGSPLDCTNENCGTTCQRPLCVEPTEFTTVTEATCGCEPNNEPGVCTSECGGSSECQFGTCNVGTCQCTNLNQLCTNPNDGPCDMQCQTSTCSIGNCVCGNLPSTTLCESNPPNYCDGKSLCDAGSCVTGPTPTCNGECSTICKKQICKNPSEFTSSTDASCDCVAAPEHEGLTCETDSIVCTVDQCDASGTCVHPSGNCTGCAIDCLHGVCTPNPTTNQQLLVWDDGCIYSLGGSDGSDINIDPPEGGTSNPICSSSTFARSMQDVLTGESTKNTPILHPAASISLFVVGVVSLIAAITITIVIIKRRSTLSNTQQNTQQNDLL